MRLDLESLENELKNNKDVLLVMSITSCFAPWEPDDIIAIGSLCRKYEVYHVINNAYGL